MAVVRPLRGAVVGADLVVPHCHQRLPDLTQPPRPAPAAIAARPPSPDPYARPDPAPLDVGWLEPLPDRLALDERADPAEVAVARQTVRLALVASAQILPPRQRAAFFLCDVLARPATEAAEVLDVSVGALKSLLQRARSRLDQETLAADQLAEPTDEGARRVLDRYMAAFERSDMVEIERLLVNDAVLEMTGTTTWFSGKATCVPFIAAQAIGHAGDWRMIPIHANGQLAAAAYHLGEGVRTTHSRSSWWPRPRPASPASRCSPNRRCFTLRPASDHDRWGR